MHAAKMYIGLDVGAYEIFGCITDEDGEIVAERVFELSSSNVTAFIEAHCRDVATITGLEAGPPSAGLARKMREAGFEVHIFEARQASKFLSIRRNKTDVNDARGIADLVRLGRNAVAEVFVKSAECQHIRSRLVLRERLTRQRMGAEGVIGAVFRMNHGRLLRANSGPDLRRKVSAELDRIKSMDALDLSEDIEPLLNIAEIIRANLASVDRMLKKQAAQIEICRQFMEIPGVGPITALSFYSAIENPNRFPELADIGPYFGLAPTVKESGSRRRDGSISRMGNVMTRTHLVRAATVMMMHKPDCLLYTWAKGLAARIGMRKARAALARKLATVMLAMWKSGRPFLPDGRIKQIPNAEAGGSGGTDRSKVI